MKWHVLKRNKNCIFNKQIIFELEIYALRQKKKYQSIWIMYAGSCRVGC